MPKPIFVVGGKHSGTTLTATILGANDKVWLIPMETGAYSKKHTAHLRKPFIEKIKTIESEFVVEKTPDHVYQINKMQGDWPDSPIFIVTRNPIDRVASTLRRHGDFGQAVYECANDMRACVQASKKSNTYIVFYEDIVKDFNNTVQRMCDFSGLEFQESMIDFHKHAPTWFPKHQHDDHHRKRSEQMKMPLYDDSGWGIHYLDDRQIEQVIFDCREEYESLMSRQREQMLLY